MIYPSMQAGRVSNTMSRMTRGTRMVQSIVRSFVQTCIRTTNGSRDRAAARAASAQTGMRSSAVRAGNDGRDQRDNRDVRMTQAERATRGPRHVGDVRMQSAAASEIDTPRTTASASASASLSATASAKPAVELPTSQPSFTRVSSRRGAMPATANPVRIYSTPSRTVMVGNLAEVSRLLDISIEREHARNLRHA